MHIRAYLRASTTEQDASRARAELDRFAGERGHTIAAYYTENQSGAAMRRPELFRLLDDCRPGDVLLVEQVDRLSRLNREDWETLKAEIGRRRVRVVTLDVPSSWTALSSSSDTVQDRILDAINAMLLDILAAVARSDYESRRKRQAQGIEKAKREGAYQGRRENASRNSAIVGMLKSRTPWSQIIAATGCSRSTLARLSKRVPKEDSPNG